MRGGGEISWRRRLLATLRCAASEACPSAYPRPQAFLIPCPAVCFIRRIRPRASGRDAVTAKPLDNSGLCSFRSGNIGLAAGRTSGAELGDSAARKSGGEFGILLQGAPIIGERFLVFA